MMVYLNIVYVLPQLDVQNRGLIVGWIVTKVGIMDG
jgi:hypothetical protein